MRYFIVAGEQSGDLHGSNLVKELIKADRYAEIRCWGGDLMEAAGAKLMMHYRKLAFMGFVAVLKNLGTIAKNMRLCREQIEEFKPDAVIFIDYPGFNLRLAEFTKKAGFRNFYYISPKLWAWNEGRVKKIKKFIDRMFIIFPFEIDFYRKHGVEATYYGNPLIDETSKRISSFPSGDELKKILGLGPEPVIALLAGSRKHEIEFVLPDMISIVGEFSDFQFVLAGVKNIPDELYNKIIGKAPVKLIKEKTYEILHIADAALVTSGTATLEAALHDTVQVVCYKADFFSMLIAWMVIKVKYISLVNLILGKEAVKELVQYDLKRSSLLTELKSILPGGKRRSEILADYGHLKEILGKEGASARVARDMVDDLERNATKAEGSVSN